jgi:hypothetical protein
VASCRAGETIGSPSPSRICNDPRGRRQRLDRSGWYTVTQASGQLPGSRDYWLSKSGPHNSGAYATNPGAGGSGWIEVDISPLLNLVFVGWGTLSSSSYKSHQLGGVLGITDSTQGLSPPKFVLGRQLGCWHRSNCDRFAAIRLMIRIRFP